MNNYNYSNDNGFSKSLLQTTIIALTIIFIASSLLTASAADSEDPELKIVQIIHEGKHETVLIVNMTREKIDLCGYILKEEENGKVYDFGKQADCKSIIPPLSVMRLHSGSGSSTYYASWQDLPWTQSDVWAETDTATLINPHGNVISTFKYGQSD